MRIITIILIFGSLTLSSQIVPYIPLEFESDIVEWSHVATDTSIIENTVYNGINLLVSNVDPISEDGFLYNVTTVTIADQEGGLVEKIRLSDGKVMWNYVYDERTLDIRESPVRLYLNDENQLEVMNYRMIEKKENDFPHYQSGTDVTYSIHVFNVETGSLIEHKYPNEANRNYSFNSRSNNNNDFITYGSDGKRYHAERELRKDTQQYIVRLLDEDLNYTEDVRKLDLGLPPVNDDYLYGGLVTTDSYNITFDAKILWEQDYLREYSLILWDKEWNQSIDLGSKIGDIIEEEDPFKIAILDATDSYILIQVFHSGKYDVNYLINTNGELIRKFDINENEEIGYSSPQYCIIDDEVIFVGVKLYQDGSPHLFEIKKIGEEDIKYISSEFNPSNQQFFPKQLVIDINNNVLCQGWQLKDTTIMGVRNRYRQGSVMLKFNSAALDLVSNVNYPEVLSFQVFPNPTQGYLELSGIDHFDGVMIITDVTGKELMRKTIQFSGAYDVDLSELQGGTYVIQLQEKDRAFEAKKILHIK